MLQTGWYRQVFVRSEDSHRPKAPLPSRDQLVKWKRRVPGRIRGSRLRKLIVERDLEIGLMKEAAAKTW